MPAIRANIKFLEWQELYQREKPFICFVDIPQDSDDKRDNNLNFENQEVTIHDVRTRENEFSLDTHGFMIRSHNTDVLSFESNVIEEVYLPEMEALLRAQIEGLGRIFFFDWRLRRNAAETWGEVIDLNDHDTWLTPVINAHNDQTALAVLNRVRRQLPEEAEQLLTGRVRVVNIWRPINHPVEDCPLAFCDGSTVSMTDLIETDHVRRNYTGSNLYALYNPHTQWYHLSDQSPEEVVFMKQFDSKVLVNAKCCPHAAFHLPTIRSDALPRESIEVRALIFSSD